MYTSSIMAQAANHIFAYFCYPFIFGAVLLSCAILCGAFSWVQHFWLDYDTFIADSYIITGGGSLSIWLMGYAYRILTVLYSFNMTLTRVIELLEFFLLN